MAHGMTSSRAVGGGERSSWILLLLLVTFLVGCGEGSSGEAPQADVAEPSQPIVVVAADGLEWNLLLDLLKRDEMPNLERLMERGRYGLLGTFRPTKSPVLWTTVATGKRPNKHGITDFTYFDSKGERKLLNSSHRRTKALWNILSDYDRSVHSLGWWMTFPVEDIRGVMVAQTNSVDQVRTRGARGIWKGTLRKGVPGQVHPASLQDEVMAILEEVDEELPALLERIFGRFPHPLTELTERFYRNCQWAFRADTTYVRVLERLRERGERADLTLIYLGGTDVVGHHFWRYMEPEAFRYPPEAEQVENFGKMIPDYYRYFDQLVGRIVANFPEDATFFLLSDHGMGPANVDQRFDPDQPQGRVNSGGHIEGPPGVIIAAGPLVRPMQSMPAIDELKRADLVEEGDLLDVTPTLLAMLAIPRGEDMDGRVREGWIAEELAPYLEQVGSRKSHDPPGWKVGAGRENILRLDEVERLNQLESMGYFGAEMSTVGEKGEVEVPRERGPEEAEVVPPGKKDEEEDE